MFHSSNWICHVMVLGYFWRDTHASYNSSGYCAVITAVWLWITSLCSSLIRKSKSKSKCNLVSVSWGSKTNKKKSKYSKASTLSWASVRESRWVGKRTQPQREGKHMPLMIKCLKKSLWLMGSPESTREKHVCASPLLVVWEVTVVFLAVKLKPSSICVRIVANLFLSMGAPHGPAKRWKQMLV